MNTQFEIEVEYESLSQVILVVNPQDDEVFWQVEWNRHDDLLQIDALHSCDLPMPEGAMEECFIILNERLDILNDDDEENEIVDDYLYNGVRRSDFY